MGEPLMEALLDFKVFFTNRQYDVQFGRIDIESMDWFPGGISNENMNKWAAELLDGPPLLRKSGYGLLLGCRSGFDRGPFEKTFF